MNSLKILSFTADDLPCGLYTDEIPRFSFSYTGRMDTAEITLDGCTVLCDGQIGIEIPNVRLKPYTEYTAILTVHGNGMQDKANCTFRTGRMDVPWKGIWITDGAYSFTEKKVSPKVMVFRCRFGSEKQVSRAEILATAIGIYELTLNGKKVGNQYFAPGFTSYEHNLQYQSYDITEEITHQNTLIAEVSGGWAVGSFVMTRANRITAPRQALLLEIRLTYTDGSVEVIGTNEDWEVSTDGPVRMADLYDGETYDARILFEQMVWHSAAAEHVKIRPRIRAAIGLPVCRKESFQPNFLHKTEGKAIYDLGQNFAGVVGLTLSGKAGQRITIRHAEILKENGDLNTAFLRTAKATFTYICRDGFQSYAPRFTYMGFRYISVEGAEPEEIELKAWAVYSDIRENGSFSCSNSMINRLHENIRWGARSNFVEIPTDCPQRDERMGWTGDIALFAPTACYNFDMSRFLRKWLRDLRSEQNPGGSFPNTIPSQGYGFPATMFPIAVDFWDDACILVPWAVYMATGDKSVLSDGYTAMERYIKACRFWAGIWGLGKHRYIWHTPAMLHFGDWVAPDVPKMSQWQGRSRWTATASLCNSAGLMAKISRLLGKEEEAVYYEELAAKVADAYESILLDSNAQLKNEFQTGYVLPLYFRMLSPEKTAKAAQNLSKLVKRNNYRIGTGFPGTPYLLFALADNGYAEDAFRMLLNTECPSWLYEVRAGATTIWERWDGLDENGRCPIGDDGTGGMISYNHYASGAVGDFLYRRIAGIEPLTGGYKQFAIRPLVGGDITWAKGSVNTPYGTIVSDWKQDGGRFTIRVDVPEGTICTLTTPGGMTYSLSAGSHIFSETKGESSFHE